MITCLEQSKCFMMHFHAFTSFLGQCSFFRSAIYSHLFVFFLFIRFCSFFKIFLIFLLHLSLILVFFRLLLVSVSLVFFQALFWLALVSRCNFYAYPNDKYVEMSYDTYVIWVQPYSSYLYMYGVILLEQQFFILKSCCYDPQNQD